MAKKTAKKEAEVKMSDLLVLADKINQVNARIDHILAAYTKSKPLKGL